MASTGAAKAKKPNPQELITVTIHEGKASENKIVAYGSQRITFHNRDEQDYRLRLRHGIIGKPVAVSVFLQAGKSAEFITEPDVCEKQGAVAGHRVLLEILSPGMAAHAAVPAVLKALSGTVPKGPGGGPRFELEIVNLPRTN
jgi:hypothetical protein